MDHILCVVLVPAFAFVSSGCFSMIVCIVTVVTLLPSPTTMFTCSLETQALWIKSRPILSIWYDIISMPIIFFLFLSNWLLLISCPPGALPKCLNHDYATLRTFDIRTYHLPSSTKSLHQTKTICTDCALPTSHCQTPTLDFESNHTQ